MNEDNSPFKIEVSSDLDYEGMVINLICGNGQIAILSCDEGIDKAKIEILNKYDRKVMWELNYKTFIKYLRSSFEALKEVNEISD